MHQVIKQFFWLMVWGIAFAYIEASVVVYLRKIYYPQGFSFPVVIAQNSIIIVEVVRELATLVILWATASLAYPRVQSRVGAFMVLFGTWDIFYYLFLKLVLNWPQDLESWDILFLIPLPWAGPVWAPVVVSLGLVYSGSAILLRNEKGFFLDFDRAFIWIEFVAAAVIIVSFLIPGQAVIEQSTPEHFPYYLFWAGFIAGFSSFLYKFYRSR